MSSLFPFPVVCVILSLHEWTVLLFVFQCIYLYMSCHCEMLVYYLVIIYKNKTNRIGGVMVSLIASSAVDRGFEPRSVESKDFKISICCFSAKHAALRKIAKIGQLGIRIMCPNGATWLPADWCFSALAPSKSNSGGWSGTKRTSSSFQSKINLFSPWYSYKIVDLSLNNNHSLPQKQRQKTEQK